MNDFAELAFMETPLIDAAGFMELILRFVLNMVVVVAIIRFFYYPKSRRRDYFFTFTLISISIFLMIFLLGSVKLKIGFALGLFAIFGIIRYRTESMPVREMTYLFVIIAISVINALSVQLSYAELTATNLLFILCIWLCEINMAHFYFCDAKSRSIFQIHNQFCPTLRGNQFNTIILHQLA